jgi:FlaA1/EpsC-like NDP-sugar epimerase
MKTLFKSYPTWLTNPRVRMGLVLAHYTVGLCLSLWLAFEIRFGFQPPPSALRQLARALVWFVPLQLFMLWLCGVLKSLPGYFSVPGLVRLFHAQLFSALVLWLVSWKVPHLGGAVSRTIIVTDFLLGFLVLAAICLAFRLMREYYQFQTGPRPAFGRRVGIVGAGDAATRLARELSIRKGLGLVPVAYFDDDRAKWKTSIHNIPVIGPPETLLNGVVGALGIQEVIIAMPSAPAQRIAEVVRVLNQAKLKFYTVPSLEQMTTGQVSVSNLRPVEIEDVLGRPPVQLETPELRRLIANRAVMVTGAGGSIGSELARQIAVLGPSQLLLLDRSEPALFVIEQELHDKGIGSLVTPLVADVGDVYRMRRLLSSFRPAIIFHAAAHKHVPMMELHPGEAIKNNAVATARLADLALQVGVERLVMISTDKAINPTSVMGASKRLAEMYIQALAAANPGRTKFMAVRFGNVLGSSGSVIPIFKQQIARGGPVTVTHPDMKRYFMTIPEAAGLVIQSATLGQGGEIFILDMGEPVKIVDLARQLIQLSGLRPEVDIPLRFVGLRPGEKLFEELSYPAESHSPTAHPKIMRFTRAARPLPEMQAALHSLEREALSADPDHVRALLRLVVPEYEPAMPALASLSPLSNPNTEPAIA